MSTSDDIGRVELRGVHKRFSRSAAWVLDGVDLTAAAGTQSVVVGGNGSGKSTLLRIVAGASRPTRGRILRPRPVAYVPERLPVHLRMDARRYIAHMGRLRGLDVRTGETRAQELFERLALRPGPDVPVGELSKGNSQKVALAQAFLAPVRLLVLDEPFSGLDPQADAELADLIGTARSGGATVLLSAHDTGLLPDADATHLLVDGRLGPVTAPSERARPGMRLVLVAIDDGVSHLELARTPGVYAADYDWSHRRLVVLTDDADTVLARALGSGWSFLHGQPETEREGA